MKQSLENIRAAVSRRGWQDIDPQEPFLAVSERFERIDPEEAGGLENWYLAAVLEQAERLRHLSPYGAGPGALLRLERLLETGIAAPWVERRYQLIRLRHGRQDAPAASPLLAKEHNDNLNPGYWSGVRHSVSPAD